MTTSALFRPATSHLVPGYPERFHTNAPAADGTSLVNIKTCF